MTAANLYSQLISDFCTWNDCFPNNSFICSSFKKIISSNIFSVIKLITEKLWNFEKRIYCRHIQVIRVAIRKGNSHERYLYSIKTSPISWRRYETVGWGWGWGWMDGFCFIQTGLNTCWTKLNYILFTLTQIIYFRFIYKRLEG